MTTSPTARRGWILHPCHGHRRLAEVPDSLPRTLIWSAVWEMTRNAQIPARDFVALAVRGIPTEDQIGVVQRVFSQLHLSVGSYAEPALGRATTGVAGWCTAALREVAVAAEPASDPQFASVPALAGGEARRRAAGRGCGLV